MAIESCSICGEPKDENELDPHGHFSPVDDDGPCEVCDKYEEEHYELGEDPDHEFAPYPPS